MKPNVFSRGTSLVRHGAGVTISNHFSYDGTLYLRDSGIAELAGTLIKQALYEFPELIDRDIQIKADEGNVELPTKEIYYSHSKVTVTVEFKEKTDEN